MLDLRNYIGLRCVVEDPSSGKFVDDLEGISGELVNGITDSDKFSFGEMWRKIERRSIDRFIDEVKLLADETGNYHEQIYDSQNINFKEPAERIGNEESYYGLKIEVPYSKHLIIPLESFSFYSYTADVLEERTIKVWDLITGDLIHETGVFGAVEGLNEVPLNILLEPKVQKVSYFIGMGASDIELLQTKEDCYQLRNEGSYYHDCGCFDNEEFEIYPSKASNLLTSIQETNLQKSEKGYGVTVNYKVECSIEKYIEFNLSKFCVPFWYFIGAELLNEKLSSLNTSYFAVTDLERTEYVMKELKANAMKSMNRLIKAAPLDSLCYDCYGKNLTSQGWLIV